MRIGLQARGSWREGLLQGEFKENSCPTAMANLAALGKGLIIGADRQIGLVNKSAIKIVFTKIFPRCCESDLDPYVKQH